MASRLRADFQPHELSNVLAHYHLGAIQGIERQLKGSRRSPKVIISADKGQFLLKRRARGRDYPVKVASSHHVQQFLHQLGFPLPRLVPTKTDNDTMLQQDGLIYELFEFIQGGPYDYSVPATRDAGRVLGMFHQFLHDYRLEWEPSRRGYHDANSVRTSLNSIPASIGKDDSVVGKESELLTTVSSLYDEYETASEQVNNAGYYQWRAQIVHADWHPGNMLFRDGRIVAVIDYDSLHLLPPVSDLANGVLQFSILGGPIDPLAWPAELDEARFTAFLEGYLQEQECIEAHLRMLPALMIEALIAEAVMPIAATGSFGRMEGFRFLQMIDRKARWLHRNADRLVEGVCA